MTERSSLRVPQVVSQILIEPGSPEDFHVMEVKNVSRDGLSVTGFGEIASAARTMQQGMLSLLPAL
jgi:hypothetical protein